MGTALVNHLATVPDIALLAMLDSGESVDVFLAAKPDVVVDLSLGPAVDGHGPTVAAAGIPYIIGATGFRAETVEELRSIAETSQAGDISGATGYQSTSLAEGRASKPGTPVLIVPNFSLGATLMQRFAAQAAAFMHAPVVTERHHAGKADAPSGTAVATAQRIAQARNTANVTDKPSTAQHFHEQRAGSLGTDLDGVAVHSVRGAGYLAEQEVRFTLPGEMLCIEHRALDRSCYLSGIVYAIRNVHRVHGLQIGLDSILEF
jgi:4-hydroxy-tetrahydrodipicolinate reductase